MNHFPDIAAAIKKSLGARVWAYGFAVLCAAAALAIAAMIRNPFFPTPVFFAAIAISAWNGGVAPGLVTTALATLSLNYYFLPPIRSFRQKPDATYLIDFAVSALVTCWFIRQRRIAESALRDARDELQSRFEEKQAELTRVSRIMSVGEMGVSIAHEVNQPLMAVVLNGDAAVKWLDADPPNLPEVRHALESIVAEGTRAGEIVRRIRGMAKKTSDRRVPVSLNEIVAEVTAMLDRVAARHGVLLTAELAPALPPVIGDRIQLQQVIFNLAMNAIEAMSSEQRQHRELRVCSRAIPGSLVSVTLEDSGPGLPVGDPDRLFSAFFTTKPEGLGIGLSISRTIIEAHGGRLSARNLTKGSAFEFELPVATEERK